MSNKVSCLLALISLGCVNQQAQSTAPPRDGGLGSSPAPIDELMPTLAVRKPPPDAQAGALVSPVGACLPPQNDEPPPAPSKPVPRYSHRGRKPISELLRETGREFQKDVGPYSLIGLSHEEINLADLWSLADKILTERAIAEREKYAEATYEKLGADVAQKMALWTYDNNYGKLAAEILSKGGRADFDRFLRVYDAQPPGAKLREVLIEPLTQFRMREEVGAALRQPSPSVRLSRAAVEVPKALDTAPQELEQALLCYRSVVAILAEERHVARGAADAIAVQQHWDEFYAAYGDLLHRRPGDNAARLRRFYWGGHCGTGSDALHGPQNAGVILGYLQQRDYEHLAALLIEHPAGSRYASIRDEDGAQGQRIALLKWLGLDPPQVLAGYAVDRGWGSGQVDNGSERSARYLLELFSLTSLKESRSQFISTFEPFIDPGVGATNTWQRPRIPHAASAATQARMLELIVDEVRDANDAHQIEAAARILIRLRRPETVAALRKVAEMPLERVKREAAEALRAMGQSAPKLQPARPLVLRISVNGRVPPIGTEVWWEAKRGGGHGTSSTAKTDADGKISIDRDYVSGRGVDVIELRTPESRTKMPELWFKVSVPLPPDLDQPVPVSVPVGDLRLRFAAPLPTSVRAVELKLTYLGSGACRPFQDKACPFEHQSVLSWKGLDVPASTEIVIPGLGSGKYQVEVAAAGVGSWKSELVVEQGGVDATVRLAPSAGAKQ